MLVPAQHIWGWFTFSTVTCIPILKPEAPLAGHSLPEVLCMQFGGELKPDLKLVFDFHKATAPYQPLGQV